MLACTAEQCGRLGRSPVATRRNLCVQLGTAMLGVSTTMAVYGSLGVILGGSHSQDVPAAASCTPAMRQGSTNKAGAASQPWSQTQGACATGTSINWQLDGRLNRAALLFPGIGCFLLAIALGVATNALDVRGTLRRERAGQKLRHLHVLLATRHSQSRHWGPGQQPRPVLPACCQAADRCKLLHVLCRQAHGGSVRDAAADVQAVRQPCHGGAPLHGWAG